jgi:alpha-tubulin suppressor-like RCC1 family protein
VPTDVIGLASGVIAVSAGGDRTCAVVNGGDVRCWGDNTYNLIGNGTVPVTQATTPSDVVGITKKVDTIATGGGYSCAVIAGTLKCWGGNASGQLGNGRTVDAFTPTPVTGLGSDVVAVAAGGNHSCALTALGGVKCWGNNLAGKLGDGTTMDSLTPVDVVGLGSGAVAIAVGGVHSCAVMNTGGVKCWGLNSRLGIGISTGFTPVPTDVTSLSSGVVAITAGFLHTCVVTSGGGVKCWGVNSAGQIGSGNTTNALVPTDVIGLSSGAIEVAAGGSHTCSIIAGSGVKCWGDNSAGQLGNNTTVASLVPTDVSGLGAGVARIATGSSHSCAVTNDGGAKCWGYNANGQLGNNTTVNALVPSDVSGLSNGVVGIAAGGHTCAASTSGGAKCWGPNTFGELGDGAPPFFLTPVTVLLTACADFLDVAPTSAFCRNVEWLKNRAVTLGCTLLNSYCPTELVNRLAMAAFMNRLGTALSGTAVWLEASSAGALDLDTSPVVCQTGNQAGSNFVRRAFVAGVLSGTSASLTGLGISLVASFDSGTTWQTLRPRTTRTTVPANRWGHASERATFDLEAAESVRFGIRVSRDALPAGSDLSDSRCALRVFFSNRNSPVSPFDIR